MPRYEIRRTSDNARTYVEGDLPLDLFLSQAAGTYRARVMSAEEPTDIVVPTLTASIVQSSLTVGDTATLTTNAPAGSTFQWRLDGTDISGATSGAGYTTAAAGALTCRVTIPGNPQGPVTTAAVTVSSGITPASRIHATGANVNGVATSHSANINIASALAGDDVYVLHINNEGISPGTFTIAGNSAGSQLFSETAGAEQRRVYAWKYTLPANGSSSVAFEFSNYGGNGSNATSPRFAVFVVRGGAYDKRGYTAVSGTSVSADITPAEADTLILCARMAGGSLGTGVTWTNATGLGEVASGNVALAEVVNAPASARTVSVSHSNSQVGHLTLLAISPA